MTITKRTVKGSALTFLELDGNFDDLSGRIDSVQSTVNNIVDGIIYVTQENAATTLGGTIDSTKLYLLTCIIDMTGLTITVPATGIYISGYNFDISGIKQTGASETLFTSLGSGNVLFNDFFIECTGAGSKVYDLISNTGSDAFEINRINYNNCTSLGELKNFRQGLETGTGRFGGTPELTLSGTWLGGYFIDTSIVRNLVNGSYTLFKAGTGFQMNSRFRSNANVDLPANVSYLDFTSAQFPNPSTLQLVEGIVTRDGVANSSDTNLTPNVNEGALSSAWAGNTGLRNTFTGGVLEVTAEVETVINNVGVHEVIDGTYTASNLQHYDNPQNGRLRHLGTDPTDYRVNLDIALESDANNVLEVKIVKYDASADQFEDIYSTSRIVNNYTGQRDVAIFNLSRNLILEQNDYVRLEVANLSGTANVTAELGSSIVVEER